MIRLDYHIMQSEYTNFSKKRRHIKTYLHTNLIVD